MRFGVVDDGAFFKLTLLRQADPGWPVPVVIREHSAQAQANKPQLAGMCTSEIRHGGSLRSEADSHSQFSHKCHKDKSPRAQHQLGTRDRDRDREVGDGYWNLGGRPRSSLVLLSAK